MKATASRASPAITPPPRLVPAGAGVTLSKCMSHPSLPAQNSQVPPSGLREHSDSIHDSQGFTPPGPDPPPNSTTSILCSEQPSGLPGLPQNYREQSHLPLSHPLRNVFPVLVTRLTHSRLCSQSCHQRVPHHGDGLSNKVKLQTINLFYPPDTGF